MKKKLLFFPLVALILISLVAPVSAASYYDGVIIDGWVYFTDLNPGKYTFSVFQESDPDFPLVQIPVLEIQDGTFRNTYTNLDSQYSVVQLMVVYDSGRLVAGLAGEGSVGGSFVPIFDDPPADLVVRLTPIVDYTSMLTDYIDASGDVIWDIFSRVESLYYSDLGLTLPGAIVVGIAGAAIVLGLVILVVALIRGRK